MLGVYVILFSEPFEINTISPPPLSNEIQPGWKRFIRKKYAENLEQNFLRATSAMKSLLISRETILKIYPVHGIDEELKAIITFVLLKKSNEYTARLV